MCVNSAIILNSFVVLYLEFCAWFNLKGEVGESLTKHERYFNWYTFLLENSPKIEYVRTVRFLQYVFAGKNYKREI